MRAACVLAVLAAVMAPSVSAQPPVNARAAAATRRENLDRMLAAYKAVNSQLKSDRPDLQVIQAGAERMGAMARTLPTWFPAGSGQGSGADTNALPVIWREPARFQAANAALIAAVEQLKATVPTGRIDLIRTEQRNVSAACDACHRSFEDRF
jgi:cytochrome c556